MPQFPDPKSHHALQCMVDTATHTTHKKQLQLDSNGILVVLPWRDPVVDQIGFDIRGDYVETFWLGILGPTTTWLMRRIDAGFDFYPEGYELNLIDTAAALGLTFNSGRGNPFTRALQRCIMFGAAREASYGLEVRRFLPPLSARNLARLPLYLRESHADWLPSNSRVSGA